MKRRLHLPSHAWVRAARTCVASIAVAFAAFGAGCLDRPIEPVDPRLTTVYSQPLPQTNVDKIDLLLMIDNSSSMADKQNILSFAVPNLVQGLLNPPCIDKQGNKVVPATSTEICAAGSKREFPPVFDVHIGIVTSSLGGHGTDECPLVANSIDETGNPTKNDHGELVVRPAPSQPTANTYKGEGFLDWDPKNQFGGITTLGAAQGEVNDGLIPTLRDMVIGTGESGCGYEAQLESWYRFLVDPHPYASINPSGNAYVPSDGDDTMLLAERGEFLRPSSLLAIIMLTDENDCSVKDTSVYPAILDSNIGPQLPRARAICATHPDDVCCGPCTINDPNAAPAGCSPDPTCATNNGAADAADTNIYLRCFHQKEKFGIDFLYPTSRYIDGLTQATVTDRFGNVSPNPIYDVNTKYYPDDHGKRDKGLVFLAGIVGVPWQDIALDPTDLKKGFKNSDEMNAPVGKTQSSTWDYILGNPESGVLALDPHMQESIAPRSGSDPIPDVVGATISPPGSSPNADAFNGHEYTIAQANDLQYACVFDLANQDGSPATRDCTDKMNALGCDCGPGNDKPICETNSNGTGDTLQYRAKAYPGLRELEVLKGVGDQGIVGSVCPAQLNNIGAADYGYLPAIQGFIDRLKNRLDKECLPLTLHPDPSTSQVSCLMIEARATGGMCDTTCKDYPDRHTVVSQEAVDEILADPDAQAAGYDCFCQINQCTDADPPAPGDLTACLKDDSDAPVNASTNMPVNGWCYVDPAVEANANKNFVAKCPATERRALRFVGYGQPRSNSTVYITCSGE